MSIVGLLWIGYISEAREELGFRPAYYDGRPQYFSRSGQIRGSGDESPQWRPGMEPPGGSGVTYSWLEQQSVG